ncbi:uncharacterized protein LOC131071470 isoform X3 [Cryptomeria japonica]|nr:uncharacterized protein LOC131071470 isoform X3 [Cryptomeria japonica]
MCSPGLSWVCDFFQHNFTFSSDIVANGISKEKEKDLLMLLSTVCRHFRRNDFEQECGTHGLIDNVENLDLCRHGKGMANHNCIDLVAESLVFLLVLESSFISHLAGKSLYVLSCYLMELDSEWKEFLHYLWISLKVVCSKIKTQPMFDSAGQSCPYAMDQRSFTSGSIALKEPYYISYLVKEVCYSDLSNNSTCLKKIYIAASQLMQLLRNILKACNLKTEKHVDSYVHITETYIVDIAWVLLNNLCLNKPVCPVKDSCDNSLIPTSNQAFHDVEKELVLGSLIQILCSLVHAIASKHNEVGGVNLASHWPLLTKVNEMIPALSIPSLALHNHPGQSCISDFLRYKLLMLMIRLSHCFLQKPSFFVLWLDLLWEHAADLLCHPLPENKIHESSLLGSPFWTSSDHCNREFNICKSHLQNRAIFLLFKCCFIMIRENMKIPKKSISCHVSSLEINSKSSVSQQNSAVESGNVKAVVALMNWLQMQMSHLSPLNGDFFSNRWITFTSSFLRLFMDEDDLMFQMLLQLLDMPLPLQQGKYNGNSVPDSKRHMDNCLPILESLRPCFLFHEFLALIQYDHLVMVDYLISKSTGTLCLCYLLRSLRVLCDSWPNSAVFSIDIGSPQITELSNHSSQLENTANKRKRELESFPVSAIAIDKSRIESSKRCLSSLYLHIESLHKKDLFPYNPSPLLKR